MTNSPEQPGNYAEQAPESKGMLSRVTKRGRNAVTGALMVAAAAIPSKEAFATSGDGKRIFFGPGIEKNYLPADQESYAAELAQLQEVLADLGYLDRSQVNGQWRESTAQAVVKFQRFKMTPEQRNRAVPGKIGSETLTAIDNVEIPD